MTHWWQQVPTLAILNAQVIGAIASEPAVQNAARATGVGGRYPLINSAFVTGLMYSILVVPRELYGLSDARRGEPPSDPLLPDDQGRPGALQRRIDELSLEKYLDVVIPLPKGSDGRPRRVHELLRHSVAHVNYAIEGDPPEWTMRFWNLDRKNVRNWEAHCTVTNLQALLLALGNVLHEYYLANHHPATAAGPPPSSGSLT